MATLVDRSSDGEVTCRLVRTAEVERGVGSGVVKGVTVPLVETVELELALGAADDCDAPGNGSNAPSVGGIQVKIFVGSTDVPNVVPVLVGGSKFYKLESAICSGRQIS